MNKRLWCFTVAMVTVSFVGSAQAPAQDGSTHFQNGNKLYADCTSNNPYNQAYCLGYVAGVTDLAVNLSDAAELDARPPKICIPLGVTQGQVKDVVIDYLRRDPQHRHVTAVVQVELALAVAWPCN